MGRVSCVQTVPPFLSKLVQLTQTIDPSVARWNTAGTVFEIVNELKFSDALKSFFKGNAQTFIRQLHFYGFRKVDTELRNSTSWGFEHEDHHFVRDNLELIKEIRRKTKIDPESQKLASVDEVQALKNQVSYLAETLDVLRTKLSTVNELVQNTTTKASLSTETYKPATHNSTLSNTENLYESHSSQLNPNNKRPRNSFIQSQAATEATFSAETLTQKDTFDQLVSKITPPYSPNLKASTSSKNVLARNNSLMSLTSLSSLQSLDDEFSEMFSDLELSDYDFEPLNNKHQQRQNTVLPNVQKPNSFEDKENVNNVYVKKISEATKVKESDVSKILNYLSNLSISNNVLSEETAKIIKTADTKPVRKLDFIRFNELSKFVPEVRAQKVAAN